MLATSTRNFTPRKIDDKVYVWSSAWNRGRVASHCIIYASARKARNSSACKPQNVTLYYYCPNGSYSQPDMGTFFVQHVPL